MRKGPPVGNGPVHLRKDADSWARKDLHDHGELRAFGLRKSPAMETCPVSAADSAILKATTQQIQRIQWIQQRQQSHQRQPGHWRLRCWETLAAGHGLLPSAVPFE